VVIVAVQTGTKEKPDGLTASALVIH